MPAPWVPVGIGNKNPGTSRPVPMPPCLPVGCKRNRRLLQKKRLPIRCRKMRRSSSKQLRCSKNGRQSGSNRATKRLNGCIWRCRMPNAVQPRNKVPAGIRPTSLGISLVTIPIYRPLPNGCRKTKRFRANRRCRRKKSLPISCVNWAAW